MFRGSRSTVVPPPARAQRLQSFTYQRPQAHIKRSYGFAQSYFGSLAHANGFDEALFVGPGDVVCEGSITNIGFVRGDTMVWPDAPVLRGVMMQVLQRGLDAAGVPWRTEAIHVADLASFEGAFLTNSHGLATVAQIDDVHLATDSALTLTASSVLAAAPFDPI